MSAMTAGELRPGDRFRLYGMAWECTRQARRTTLARSVEPEWEDYAPHLRLKKSREVAVSSSPNKEKGSSVT